jgi:hypothetical protein|tara:strand:+ start:269 stop:733 length:465 start_codon:yes stop_codon:yes gene_type:complete
MTAFKAANVTKYDDPGGDNVIPDGYIKTVEKVWVDNFSFTSAITTGDTIDIAYIPPNKKIVDVAVFMPTLAPTTSTIQVGIPGNTSLFISSGETIQIGTTGDTIVANNALRMNIMSSDGPYVTTGTTVTPVRMQIGVVDTSTSSGTFSTIVSYT